MKTAEEWVKEIDFCLTDDLLANEIKKIQLDAWKQGMSDAAEFIGNRPSNTNTSFTHNRAIIKKRDERTSL